MSKYINALKKRKDKTQSDALKIVAKMYEKGSTINDKDGIITFITPFKMAITPNDSEKLETIYNETLRKLNKRGLLKYVACYKEDNKIILERLRI